MEGKEFVPARPGNLNQEHIFGFIAGFTSDDMSRILTDLFNRWQDIAADRKENNPHLIRLLRFRKNFIFQLSQFTALDRCAFRTIALKKTMRQFY